MPNIPLGSQFIEVKIAALPSIVADNKNALWLAISDYVKMSRDYIQQFKEDVFTGRIDASDWNVAAKGEDSGKTPLFLLTQLAAVGNHESAWEFLQELINKDLLPPECWDAQAQGMSPLLMIMINAFSGNQKAWRILEALTNKGKLTVAHWNANGRLSNYEQVTPFCVLIFALCTDVENSEEFLKFLLTHLNFEAECLSTQIICDNGTYTLFEYLICYVSNREPLELLIDHNCWPNIDHWRSVISFSEGVKRPAIWLLTSAACKENPGARRLLEKIIPRIAWTPEIWNTVPADREDNPITALWLLVSSIKCGQNAAGLAEFSQLIEQNCVTKQGLHVSEKIGENAGQTIPWLLLNISDSPPEMVWDVLKRLVDRQLIHKKTWNMPDEKQRYTPIYLLFMFALKGFQPAFEILIQLIEKNIIDETILKTRVTSLNTTLIDDVEKLANRDNQVALAFFGHCAAAGLHNVSFQVKSDSLTVKRFSQDPAYWQGVEATFGALTASNFSAAMVAQKYIAKLHVIADAATCDPKFVVEFKIKIHLMYAKYFMRCGLVLQATEQVQAAAAHKSKDVGFNEIFAEFFTIIAYYENHSKRHLLQAYNLGQQCLAYAKSVKKKGAKIKSLKERIEKFKATYLGNISKDPRWQLTENHDFILALTESQIQALQDGSLVLSVLFNNIEFPFDEDANMLIIRNPIEMDQSLLSTILCAKDDTLFAQRVRQPSPESSAEDALAAILDTQCSLEDIYTRGAPCVGKVRVDPDAPKPYFPQDEGSMSDDEKLALPRPSIPLSDAEDVPPIAVTSSSGRTQFVTVKRALLARCKDLEKIFDSERKQIRFLCGGEVGAHGGAKRGEIATLEGPRPMLLLKFCDQNGDETRVIATKIEDSNVYAVTGRPIDHKEEERLLKSRKITLK